MLKGAEGVIHMGAIPGPTGEEPRQVFDNNVRGTFNVLTAEEELNPRREVFSSSAFGMGWAVGEIHLEPVVTPELGGFIMAVDDPHISYALERLIRAVDSLMNRRGDLRSRLHSAFMFIQPISPDDLPEPFRRNLKWVVESLLEDGDIDATLSTMTDSTGTKIAERFMELEDKLRFYAQGHQ